jgi:membrane protease YdiL (CAAX protease family)
MVLVSVVAVVRLRGVELSAARFLQVISEFAVSVDGILAGGAASGVTLSAVALLGARLSPVPAAARLRIGRARGSAGPLAAFVLGSVTLGALSGSVLSLLDLQRGSFVDQMNQAMAGLSGARLALALAIIGVLAPLAEELFFRGYFQTRLRERWGPWPAIAIASVAFGLLHLNLAQGLFAAVLGVYAGWAVELTGSIRPAILAHVANNTVATLLAAFLYTPGEQDAAESTTSLVAVAGIMALLTAGAALMMARAYPEGVRRRSDQNAK